MSTQSKDIAVYKLSILVTLEGIITKRVGRLGNYTDLHLQICQNIMNEIELYVLQMHINRGCKGL